MHALAVINITILKQMSTSETKNQRSVSLGLRESRQIAILLKEECQWKRTSKIKTSPSATFGKSERNSEQKRVAPGPGAYQLNRTTFEKGFVAFKGHKKIRFHTDSPGPCAYQPNVVFSSKKFSFQKSAPQPKFQQVPSPASYDLRESKTNGLSFPKEMRNLTPQKQKILFPGPGQYQSSKGFTHKNEFSFTKTKKFFASHQESQEKEANPGPAAYEISKSRGMVKSTKFAKSIRVFLEDDKIPGPASYHYERSTLLHRGGIISAQKRSFDYQNEVPGPGNYNDVPVNSIKKKEAVAIISRSREKSADEKHRVPGPGAYFSEQKQSQKILGGVIGRQLRNNQKKIIVPNLQNATKILFRQQIKEDLPPLAGIQRQSINEASVRKNHSFLINKNKLNFTGNGIGQNTQEALAQ